MMSHYPFHGMTAGAMLLLVAALAAEAQVPSTQSRTSVVQQLNVDRSGMPGTGHMRELRCRGKPGIDLRIDQDPSPRYPGKVTVALRYERPKETRSVGTVGMVTVDYGRSLQFQPGSCTWQYAGATDIPPEPGVVYFDLPRDGQAHAAARDTTINAAERFPDIVTLPRYLSDSTRYWIFFVDDVTDVSISFGRLGGAQPPTASGSVAGSLRDASPAAATLSSARVLPADGAARTTTVVRAPTPTASGGVAGPLRDKPSATSTPSVAQALPTDTAARRTATVRTPTPTGNVAGPLRAGSADSATVSTDRAQPAGSASTQPGATAAGKRLAERRISKVRTTPGPHGVRITFEATGLPLLNPHHAMRVEIEFEPPAWNPRERRWSYPTGWGGHWFADIEPSGGGRFEAEPWAKLEPGRRYHYLITVFATGAVPQAHRTGSFTADLRTPLNGMFSK
jgi:hypothetical protein